MDTTHVWLLSPPASPRTIPPLNTPNLANPCQVLVSDSSTGSPGTYCAFSVALPLTYARHVYGCGAAEGRYVVATRTGLYALPLAGLEVFLTDPSTEVGGPEGVGQQRLHMQPHAMGWAVCIKWLVKLWSCAPG